MARRLHRKAPRARISPFSQDEIPAAILRCLYRMYLEAHLDLYTLTRLIEQATPLRLHFSQSDDEQRWLEVARPTVVRLVEGQGICIETSARIRYEWAGFEPVIDIRSIELLLRPVVVKAESGLELQFQLDIEDADLVNVPALLDAGIVGIVNAAMNPVNTRLTWGFEKVLRASVPLPDRIEPLTDFCLRATGGSVSVHADHLKLRVAFSSALIRGEERDQDLPVPVAQGQPHPRSEDRSERQNTVEHHEYPLPGQ